MSNTNYSGANLHPLWSEILRIYEAVSQILDRHGIIYYGAYGTILGAVRHHGFIPWDDDFDLFVPREDYDKIWGILDRELPSHLETLTWRNTSGWNNPFGKIVETRADVVASVERSMGSMLPQGLFVDVFPLDGAPDSKLWRQFLKARGVFAYMRYTYLFRRNELAGLRSHVVAIIGFLIGPFFGGVKTRSDYFEMRERWARKYDMRKTRDCGRIEPSYRWMDRFFPTTIFSGKVSFLFEGISLPIPAGYEQFLHIMYGDYMQLPPVEKRRPDHLRQATVPWRLGPDKVNRENI